MSCILPGRRENILTRFEQGTVLFALDVDGNDHYFDCEAITAKLSHFLSNDRRSIPHLPVKLIVRHQNERKLCFTNY